MGSEITGDQGHIVMKLQYTWGALTTIAVILRFAERYAARTAGLWWDDWLSLVALVSLTPSKRLYSPDYDCFAAICLVNLWGFTLLGIYRPRQTYQSDP